MLSGRGIVEIRRFMFVGVINSALTYILYVLMNLILAYQAAYTISFAAGILLSAQLNARFTFKTTLTAGRLFKFGVVYIFNYCLGLALLVVCVDFFRWHEAVAPVAVLAVTVPVGFLGSKFILTKKSMASR